MYPNAKQKASCLVSGDVAGCDGCSMGHRAVLALVDIGFSMKEIRLALPKLLSLDYPEIGRQLGVSRGYVSNLINGNRINARGRQGVADAFGVPVDVLFPIKEVAAGDE